MFIWKGRCKYPTNNIKTTNNTSLFFLANERDLIRGKYKNTVPIIPSFAKVSYGLSAAYSAA